MSRRARPRRASRVPRLRVRKATPVTVWVLILVAVIGLLGTIVGVRAMLAPRSAASETSRAPVTKTSAPQTTTQTVEPSQVEVPALSGLSLTEAETVLSAAGLAIRIRTDGVASETGTLIVTAQDPEAGSLLSASTAVGVVVRSVEPTVVPGAKKATKKSAKKAASSKRVICIDPGHQARADSTPEPIGPGSKSVKPSVSGGATGVKTRVPEYEIALQVSMNLKSELEQRGYRVVMTRTTNDVNLSNSERAKIANDAKADLFIRIHGDGSPDSSTAGLSTLYPGKNQWTKPIRARSKKAASFIQSAAVQATGAVDRGIKQRDDLSGFNWCKVPVVLVECGFLSNPVEDRLLASPHYQDKLVAGIADGAVAYLVANP